MNNPEVVQDVLEQRRQHVEDKKERKIERYEELAEKHQKESQQRYETASKMASAIPLGQPILVGHHSEKGDRAYRKRVNQNYDKAAEHADTAQRYQDKLEGIQNNTAISSDDPDAIAKLKHKLEGLQQLQDEMKRINKIIRSTKKLEGEARVKAVAEKANISKSRAQELLTPDFCGRIGYPNYSLTNNNATIRNTKQRIEQLKADLERIAEQGESAETRHDDLGVTVIENNVVNRIQLDFDRRLTKPAYRIVKGQSFNRTREGIFQRRLNSAGRYAVDQVLKALRELDSVLEPVPVAPPVSKPEPDPTLPKSCGYCGHKHPHDTELVFCDHCIGSPYLSPDSYHLLRLMPDDQRRSKRAKLTEDEQQFLVPVIVDAQTKANAARQQQQAEKKRVDIKKEYDKAITKAQTEFDGFTWLLDHGVNTENCIFYSHTLVFSFGWQSPISVEVIEQLEQALGGFPFSVEYKTHR
ncbi:DUF3560 domain-containing protein [Acaryochloris sp. CCMEE 5410]|uniref:DUF3560 domain-containing protein n=1 Tax=Acaryochloris sp. CCMEE 5410 TaxID=310037 RepID=UPI0002484F0C|nr:DUF3560 domain-containing protein [Acaryochloris sp. CCMEE 5410]KAI9129860.1 DUF3560 domain-containing protein [Acaryochloris sp. CCMEE 5410]